MRCDVGISGGKGRTKAMLPCILSLDVLEEGILAARHGWKMESSRRAEARGVIIAFRLHWQICSSELGGLQLAMPECAVIVSSIDKQSN